MKKWSIPFPKELPDEGKTHFALAVKDKAGRRIELKGQINAEIAAELMLKVITSMGKSGSGDSK